MEKVMEKEVVKKIKERKRKEREEKKVKCVTNSLTIVEKITQRLVEKCARMTFNLTWSIIII
jgi:hypothetical protein